MKRVFCLILALALILALGAPAAAESADEQLKRVILQVKTTLDIGDDYTSFNGDSYTNGNATWWWLYWEKEDESLYVTCDDNGKVYSLNRYFYTDDDYRASGLHFPAYGFEEAKASAEAFLPKVLTAGEGFVIREQQDWLRDYGSYSLGGTLTLNGVETEMGFYLSFRTSDGALTSFSRDDSGVFLTGDIPSPQPGISAEQALQTLRGALTSDLSWGYSDYEKHEVRLTYYINLDYAVMVDARTGALLNRWDGGMRGGANGLGGMEEPEEAPAAMDDAKSLTPQEIAAAEKYENVLDGEALKAAAMGEEAFGITEDYALGNVTYRAAQPSVDPDELPEGEEPDDTVIAYFGLSKTLTEPAFGLTQKEFDELLDSGYTPTVWKQFTADARTGEIQSLYTWYSGFGWQERKDAPEPGISDTALRFLEKRYGDWLPLCRQTTANRSSWGVAVDSFTYTREEAGYLCPMNTISVQVNAWSGFVDSFSAWWDEELTFGPSGPVVGEEAAKDAYLSYYQAELCYVTVPDDPEKWDSPRHWLLVYLPDSGTGWVSGIDAVTGEADYYDWTYETLLPAYTDLEGSYARQEIEALARYGVGWYGVEEFRPADQVTELDMILLMLSAVGWQPDYGTYADASAEELESIYASAYYQGFIATREQHPDRLVTRSELCRCFVSLSGMRDAAELRGIYRCGFSDEDQIPEEDLGYVAIAKGLGVIRGDRNGAFRPNDGATRQELAMMLYRYLSR